MDAKRTEWERKQWEAFEARGTERAELTAYRALLAWFDYMDAMRAQHPGLGELPWGGR